MSDSYSIPEWFPKTLIERVKTHLSFDKQNNSVFVFERLITYPGMREVWLKLEKLSNNNQQLDNFLTFAINHPSLLDNSTDSIYVPSDKLQRKAYLSLQKNLESIIKTLNNLSFLKRNGVNDGWQLLEKAIERSELTTLESKSIKQRKFTSELVFDLNRIHESTTIEDILETMTFAAIAASHAKDSSLPKRRNTNRAKANSYSLALSKFFKEEFDEYLDELVAIVTNVAFDFKNEEITQDFVYKLRNQSKP